MVDERGDRDERRSPLALRALSLPSRRSPVESSRVTHSSSPRIIPIHRRFSGRSLTTSVVMVHLHRPHTIHEDYATKRGYHRLPVTSLRTVCVMSALSVAMAYGVARASRPRSTTSSTATSSRATASSTRASSTTKRFPTHEEVWRPTWDRGSTRKHVNNLWNDPAKEREG